MSSCFIPRPPLGVRASARLASVLLGVSLTAACAEEPKLPPLTTAAHAKAWDEWKATRATFITTPGRPQSYTGLTWLHQGSSTIGADSGNTVVLSGSNVPARVGTLIRDGRRVRFEPAAGVLVTVDSPPAVSGWLRTDNDSGGASRVTYSRHEPFCPRGQPMRTWK